MKLKSFFIISLVVFLFSSQPAMASWFRREKKIDLKKQVWDFKDEAFVDDLSTEAEHAYTSEEDKNKIRFKIIVTNSGDVNLKKIKVKDILPTDYLYYDSGDFKNENNELIAEIEDLKKGDTKELEFTAQVLNREDLPALDGHYCSFNTVQAWIEGVDKQYEDKARLCLISEKEKKEDLGFQDFPETGPGENIFLLSASTIFALMGGLFLKKKEL